MDKTTKTSQFVKKTKRILRSDLSEADNGTGKTPPTKGSPAKRTKPKDLSEMKLTFFDLQTTGLDERAHITQLSAKRGSKELNLYVRPKKPIEIGAGELTGIVYNGNLDQMTVLGKPVPIISIKEALQQFLNFMNPGSVLVGHYCENFDCRILYNAAMENDLQDEFESRIRCFVDSWSAFKRVYPKMISYSQNDLVNRFLHKDVTILNALNHVQDLQKLYERVRLSTTWSDSFSWSDVSLSMNS